jgi:hypothetical protein
MERSILSLANCRQGAMIIEVLLSVIAVCFVKTAQAFLQLQNFLEK